MIASDGQLSDNQSVTVNVNDINENQAPTIIRFCTFQTLMRILLLRRLYIMQRQIDPENDTITYSFGAGGDTSFLRIDSDDGEVRLVTSADFETKPSYTFEVIASDGQSDNQSVTVNVNDINENQAKQ